MSAKFKLLNDQWEFTEECKKILEEIFDKFDNDKSGTLSPAELDEFAKACNGGSAFSKEEHESIQDTFKCDKNGDLTREGFLEMMLLQTTGDESETKKDLKALGYLKN